MQIQKAIKTTLLGSTIITLAACGSVKGGGDNAPSLRTNTLSSAEFSTKAESSAEIFKDLKSLRGKFPDSSNSKTKTFSQLANDSQFNFDVTDEQCDLVGIPTQDATNGVLLTRETYECKSEENGIMQTCTVKISKNTSGVEVTHQETCFSSSTDDNNDDNNDQDDDADYADYMPDTSNVTDCASGFDMFESMFAKAQTDFEAASAVLKDPSQYTDDDSKLETATPAADEALAYVFVPSEDTPGVAISGRIAGGGADNKLMVRQNLDLTIDLEKMLARQQNQQNAGFPADAQMPTEMMTGVSRMMLNNTVDIDLDTRIVKSNFNLTQSSTVGSESSSSVKGVVEVSDGVEKYALQKVEVTASGDIDLAFKADLKATLVNENTLKVEGAIESQGTSENVGFELTKDAFGICKVTIASK